MSWLGYKTKTSAAEERDQKRKKLEADRHHRAEQRDKLEKCVNSRKYISQRVRCRNAGHADILKLDMCNCTTIRINPNIVVVVVDCRL